MARTQQNRGIVARLLGWLDGAPATPPADTTTALGVTWMLLPPYDIPGMAVVSGVLVENQGEQDASPVHIKLRYTGERFITHMEVVSDDPYEIEGGSPRDSFVNLAGTLPRGGKIGDLCRGSQCPDPGSKSLCDQLPTVAVCQRPQPVSRPSRRPEAPPTLHRPAARGCVAPAPIR